MKICAINISQVPLHSCKTGYGQKTAKTRVFGEDAGKLGTLYPAGGMENSPAVPQTVKYRITI